VRLPRLRFPLSERLRPTDADLTLVWAGVVGLLGALSSVLFRRATRAVQALMWQESGSLIHSAASFPWYQRLLVPSLGGLAAGLVFRYGLRAARETTDFMEAVSLGNGTIRMRPSLLKSLSSMLTVASGGSVGREGAMVQLSSMLASWFGRHMPISRQHLKLLVACGAAAGIASAYNAPIAGALFVAEIVLGSIAMESLGPLVFSSVVATTTTRVLLGPEPLFDIPPFRLVSVIELGPYLFTGIILGALAPWFVRLLRGSEKGFARLGLPLPLRFLLGGAIVGALSILRPEVWGNGYTPITSILQGEWGWRLLSAVLVAKLLATGATVGSGAVGGVFTPTLFVGASLGYGIGLVVHGVIPELSAEPSAYALVGMGSFLAGTTHAPLMAILALFEMTLDYGIVLPLMLACVAAYYTSCSIREKSIYAEVLEHKASLRPDEKTNGTIREMLRYNPVTVRADTPFEQLVRAFVEHRHGFLYVVDGTGRFLGAVSLHDIKAHMNDPALAHLLIASELMTPDFPLLARDTPLGKALQKVVGHEGERIPVVDDLESRHLLGTISKRDLLLALSLDQH